jgi:2-polyprenyl-6-methoxyphenol hydroxylase-like FAD-dependent oxidoreductase
MTRKYIEAISSVRIKEWPKHCYRCTVSKDKMYGDPLLEALLDPTKLDGTSYMHDGKYVLTWQMGPDAPFEMIASVLEEAKDIPTGKWGIHVSPEEVQDRFSHFCSPIDVALKHIESAIKWNIGDLPPLETWRSPNNRVVLAGDAAHAMTLHAAAGILSAIEDAAVLAETLTWAFQHSKPVEDAIESYEQIRKPRVTRLQEVSRTHSGFLGASGELAKIRDARLREMDKKMWETLRIPEEERRKLPKPKSDMMAPFPGQWMYGYDAIQDVSTSQIAIRLYKTMC